MISVQHGLRPCAARLSDVVPLPHEEIPVRRTVPDQMDAAVTYKSRKNQVMQLWMQL